MHVIGLRECTVMIGLRSDYGRTAGTNICADLQTTLAGSLPLRGGGRGRGGRDGLLSGLRIDVAEAVHRGDGAGGLPARAGVPGGLG